MLSSAAAFLKKLFAENGDKNAIPDLYSQFGLASFDKGFPPENSVLPPAGKFPARADFNGIGYALSEYIQAIQSFGVMPYDAAFQTAIGGYPQYAVVMYNGSLYQSLIDSNTSTPTNTTNWSQSSLLATLTAANDPNVLNSSNLPASTDWVKLNRAINSAKYSSTTGSGNNTTITLTSSFTAPCAGIAFAVGNTNYAAQTVSGNNSRLYIQGVELGNSTTFLSRSLSATSFIPSGQAVSANLICSSAVAFDANLSLLFVPTV